MEKIKTIEQFLEEKRYASPFTEQDLLDAIKFSRDLTLHEVRDMMVGIPVNGVIQSVLLEEDFLQLILKEIQ